MRNRSGRATPVASDSAGVDFARQPLCIGEIHLVADRSGALWWPAEATLVVADLHLEKGSAFASQGSMLPPYDTRETLARLAAVIAAYRPARVVALGDSLHDRDAAARLDRDARETIAALQANCEWIWITGNHDPEIGPGLGGSVREELRLGGVVLRHIADVTAREPEISGHLHPAARVTLGAATVRCRCFASDHNRGRLVLPAFGALAGGLNVLDPAIASLLGSRPHVVLLGEVGAYPVAPEALVGER